MDFYELMYSSTAIGIGCYLCVMGMHALIELIAFGTKYVHKKHDKDNDNAD